MVNTYTLNCVGEEIPGFDAFSQDTERSSLPLLLHELPASPDILIIKIHPMGIKAFLRLPLSVVDFVSITLYFPSTL